MSATSNGRMIWTFEKDHGKATEIANWLRGRGLSTRIYQRALRAEGLVAYGYVIVTESRAINWQQVAPRARCPAVTK